jgi:hypothetical protein
MPAGSRRWIAAIAKQYTDVLSEQPRHAAKRRGILPRTMRGKTPRPAPSLFGYFLGNAKK